MHWLIPIFVAVALLATLAGWFSHHHWRRTLLGSIGPVMVFAGVLGLTHQFLAKDFARWIFYVGLVVMFLAFIWDMVNPANRRRTTDGHKASAASDCD